MATKPITIPPPLSAAVQIAGIALGLLLLLSAAWNIYVIGASVDSSNAGAVIPSYLPMGFLWQIGLGVFCMLPVGKWRRDRMLAEHQAAVMAGRASPYVVEGKASSSAVAIAGLYGCAGLLLHPYAVFVSATVALVAGLTAVWRGQVKGFIGVALAIATAGIAVYVLDHARPPASLATQHMTVNGGRLGYTRDIDETLARKVGDYLVRAGFFDGQKVDAEIVLTGGVYRLRLCIQAGAEQDPEAIQAAERMATALSTEVLDSRSVELQLCDNLFKTLRSVSARLP